MVKKMTVTIIQRKVPQLKRRPLLLNEDIRQIKTVTVMKTGKELRKPVYVNTQ